MRTWLVKKLGQLIVLLAPGESGLLYYAEMPDETTEEEAEALGAQFIRAHRDAKRRVRERVKRQEEVQA